MKRFGACVALLLSAGTLGVASPPPSPTEEVLRTARHPGLRWPDLSDVAIVLRDLYAAEADGLFWYAGNLWATSGELDFGDLRHSAGAGLRYIFPFGPVRIEYGWILRRREGEPSGRFVFGLGHAF